MWGHDSTRIREERNLRWAEHDIVQQSDWTKTELLCLMWLWLAADFAGDSYLHHIRVEFAQPQPQLIVLTAQCAAISIYVDAYLYIIPLSHPWLSLMSPTHHITSSLTFLPLTPSLHSRSTGYKLSHFQVLFPSVFLHCMANFRGMKPVYVWKAGRPWDEVDHSLLLCSTEYCVIFRCVALQSIVLLYTAV